MYKYSQCSTIDPSCLTLSVQPQELNEYINIPSVDDDTAIAAGQAEYDDDDGCYKTTHQNFGVSSSVDDFELWDNERFRYGSC